MADLLSVLAINKSGELWHANCLFSKWAGFLFTVFYFKCFKIQMYTLSKCPKPASAIAFFFTVGGQAGRLPCTLQSRHVFRFLGSILHEPKHPNLVILAKWSHCLKACHAHQAPLICAPMNCIKPYSQIQVKDAFHRNQNGHVQEKESLHWRRSFWHILASGFRNEPPTTLSSATKQPMLRARVLKLDSPKSPGVALTSKFLQPLSGSVYTYLQLKLYFSRSELSLDRELWTKHFLVCASLFTRSVGFCTTILFYYINAETARGSLAFSRAK